MTRKIKQISLGWIDMAMCFATIVLPVILVWNNLTTPEPSGLWDTIKTFSLVIFTGLGSLGVGLILTDKLIPILKEIKEINRK